MASAASCRAAESWPQARRRCRSRGGWAVGRSAGHDVRAVGEYRRDEPEHVAVGVEQVAHAADALHVRQWERLGAAEIEALLEQLIDTAVDADDDVAPVHRSPALWGRALALAEPAVDAVAGFVRAHGTLTGVDGPVRHVAELGELPTEQFAVEVNEPLRLGRVYLEVHDKVRHDASLGHSNSRYAGAATSSGHPTMPHSAVGFLSCDRGDRSVGAACWDHARLSPRGTAAGPARQPCRR